MADRQNYTSISRAYYREDFISILGPIVGGTRAFAPTDQCFCQDASIRKLSPDGQGKCFPQRLCQDCNLNRSGECNQSDLIPWPGVGN